MAHEYSLYSKTAAPYADSGRQEQEGRVLLGHTRTWPVWGCTRTLSGQIGLTCLGIKDDSIMFSDYAVIEGEQAEQAGHMLVREKKECLFVAPLDWNTLYVFTIDWSKEKGRHNYWVEFDVARVWGIHDITILD